MVELYVWLALFLSIIEAALVAYRYRADPGRGRMLFYAVGAGVLTFILVTGLAQAVWRAASSSSSTPTAPGTLCPTSGLSTPAAGTGWNGICKIARS